MSDHTPTTEDVRRCALEYWPPITGEEFDRWLRAHDAEVLAQGVELAWEELFDPEEESESDSIRYGLADEILTNLATLIRARGGKP